MMNWAHLTDVSFEASADALRAVTCDGDVLFTVPSDWSESQARLVMCIANKAFNAGHEAGRHLALRSVREAIGIDSTGTDQ